MRISALLFIKFIFFIVPIASWAFNLPISAERNFNEPWQTALEKQFEKLENLGFVKERDLFYENEASSLNNLPEWKAQVGELNNLNQQAYLNRRYSNPNKGNFQRRAAWLFPVDGCYAKAAHVSAEAVKRGYAKPGKIFAYGHLRFNSPYARNGKTTYWSYHVAAGYRIGSNVYILDPMINRDRALSVSEWLNLISKNPASVRTQYCDANAYSPYSKCRGSKGNGAYLGHMQGILKQEWSNLVKLGYSPVQLLGP